MKKAVLCDSSALISLTDSCLLGIIKFLSKRYNIDFLIPPDVRKEIVDRPLSIQMKAYQLSALRMKEAIEEETLIEVNADTEKDAKKLLEVANNIFFAQGRPIHLIDLGEADMIALAHILDIDLFLMDERTTRMLIEAPFRLKEHLQKELGVNIMINRKNLDYFETYTKGMSVIRSVELITLAYEKGYFKNRKFAKEMYEASLYSLKYNGCAVSFEEIEELIEHEAKND